MKTYILIFGLCLASQLLLNEALRLQPRCSSAQFTCEASGKCIPKLWKCDEDEDCEDGSDEKECTPRSCSETEFRCSNGKCIPQRWFCDGDNDCSDEDKNGVASDENSQQCSLKTCASNQFSCGVGNQCIPMEWKCDDQEDCPNGVDEKNCGNATCNPEDFSCRNSKCITKRWKCDGDNDCGDDSDEVGCPTQTCSSDEFMCVNSSRCIPSTWKCDGDNDCHDGSDELDCSTTATARACSAREFQCASHDCIHKSWQCDGESDCVDGSDEVDCPSNECSVVQMKCKSGECILGSLVCNGQQDCKDGSDEAECTNQPDTCNFQTQFDCHKDGKNCISLDKVCNGRDDCGQGEDEALDLCNRTDPCSASDKFGCAHECKSNFNGPYCTCREGYKLGSNNKTCEDIDECEVFGKCSQTCTNTKGHFKCSCQDGYTLDPKTHRCRATGLEPRLLFANRHDLREIRLETRQYREIMRGLRSAIGMDYDYEKEQIFWTDVTKEQIFVTNLTVVEGAKENASKPYELVVHDTSTADGIAYDWIHKILYWTDTGRNTIELITMVGRHRKTLLDLQLDEPRAIAVDPRDDQKWIYWSDWGENGRIEKAGLDGSHRTALITTDIQWPNGLTIDYSNNRLYWVDAKQHQICTSDLNGLSREVVLTSFEVLKHPFAITVFEDSVYWTDWETETIHKANKFNGAGLESVAVSLYSPMDVHVYHELRQPKGSNPCGVSNGKCSHICLPAPYVKADSPTYSCACPDGGTLEKDGLTCNMPELSTAQPANGTASNTSEPSDKPAVPPKKSIPTKEGPQVRPAEKNQSHKPIPDESEDRDIGKIAGIVIAIIVAMCIIGAIVAYIAYRSYTRRNIKSMNFDNPVYRKTTEDQFSLEKNQYQPSRSSLPSTLEPLTSPSTELV